MTTDPRDAIDRDALPTNVMLYWITVTAGSSANLYYETAHAAGGWNAAPEPSVATEVAVFAHDVSLPIRRFAERANRIVHCTQFHCGGHFAALEVPDLLVDDIRATLRLVR